MKYLPHSLTLLSLTASSCFFFSSPVVQAFTEGELQEITTQVNQQLPMTIDGLGRLDSLTVVNGQTLSFNYTDLQNSSQQYTPTVVDKVNQAIRSHACENQSAALFLQEGISLQFTFHDTAKKLLTQVLVQPSECGY